MNRQSYREQDKRYASKWTGEYRRYDLVKEFVAALAAVLLLTVVLAVIFGSPDRKAISLAEWATAAPNDFVATTVTELDGSSGTATYGAPYTKDSTVGADTRLGPLPIQRFGAVTEPIDTVNDFVLRPLRTVTGDSELNKALKEYDAATAEQRQAWAQAYDEAYAAATEDDPDTFPAKVADGAYGPVPVLASKLLEMARSGALEGQLLGENGFYQIDYAKPLLFLADGGYLESQAEAEHLGGGQWGMMNETGAYPGQAWLWLYSFWYQIPPFANEESTVGANADALIWIIMMALSALLVLVPFVPGLRAIPRRLGLYRLVWRDYYRARRSAAK
jgi:hypothetical protein